MTKSAKRLAYEILRKYGRKSHLTYYNLFDIIESKGFRIIFYHKYSNQEATMELITKLQIEEEIINNDSFVYLNQKLKFVFINMDLTEDEKYILLCHELGHICDPKIQDSETEYSKIKKEEFANEFSYHLQNPNWQLRFASFLYRRRVFCVLLGIIVMLCVGACFAFVHFSALQVANVSESAENLYYVTSSGRKYHRKFCFMLKSRTNIIEYTLEDAIEKGYTACLFCIGEEE